MFSYTVSSNRLILLVIVFLPLSILCYSVLQPINLMSHSISCVDETLAGLIFDVKKAIESLTTSDQNDCVTSIESGCELFLHFITRSRGSIDNMVSFA